MWLRVYTRDEAFHGLIQGAYRRILKSLAPSGSPASTEAVQEEEEEGFDPDVLSGPGSTVVADSDVDVHPIRLKAWHPLESPTLGDSPSTPRMLARNVSTGSIGSGMGAADGRSRTRNSSFSENQFTTVPPNGAPSHKPRSKRGGNVSQRGEAQGSLAFELEHARTTVSHHHGHRTPSASFREEDTHVQPHGEHQRIMIVSPREIS